MKLYRIDHVAQVAPSLDTPVRVWKNLFGFRPLSQWTNPESGTQGIRLQIPGHRSQVWEVLAPIGRASHLQTYLNDHGGRGGFHHVAVVVPDLEVALDELASSRLTVSETSPEGWVEVPLTHPDEGAGILFRLRGPQTRAFCGDAGHPLDATDRDGDQPSLGIVAMDHICQAARDRDRLSRWYQERVGFVEIWRTPDGAHADMADLVLNIPGSETCWEVLMPQGDSSFIDRFLTKNGPAAHHVTFEVADWDQAMAACRYYEIVPFDEEAGVTDGASWRHTFIHPKATGGILVQLFWEQRPGVWVRSDKTPSTGGVVR